ncbi:hypothetical protein D3C78_1338290 [compost metagenome]
MGIDPGADRRTALGQGLQARQHILQVADIGLELLRPTVEHLAQTHRHGIHQMGATRFDEWVDLFGLALDHLHQVQQRRQQLLMQGQGSADMNAGGDDVVAALAAIDVVVRVDRLSQQAAGEGGDHFVGVHVGAGAGAGLEDIHRKMVHETAFEQPQ